MASHRYPSWHPSPQHLHPDLPTIVFIKYAYADDLAITHPDGDWRAEERVLGKDMVSVGEYVHIWNSKLVSAVFHLRNKEAKRELKLNYNNQIPLRVK